MSLDSLLWIFFLSLFAAICIRISVHFVESIRISEFDNELRHACCLSGSNLEFSFRCNQDRVLWQWKQGDKSKLLTLF